MEPKIYLIPGLLTNETIYKGLSKELPYQTEVLEFIPAIKNENLQEYAIRFARQIDTSQPFYLLGTSFGGILAIELSNLIQPEGLILISAAKNRSELSVFMRQKIASKAVLKHIPSWIIKKVYTKGFHIGSKFIPSYKAIYTEDVVKMINSIDGKFEKWVMQQFPLWNGENKVKKTLHIHGDKDHVFPIKRIKNHVVIKGGTHAIIINRYKEIADLISTFIESKES